MKPLTTFIIPTIKRDTLTRAIQSANGFPVMVMHDKDREGQGIIRQRMIESVKTPWVSFLDDDDTITADYVDRLMEEIEKCPYADVIHFREYFLTGQLLPSWPEVRWGNIGISFSVQRRVALEHPFKSEPYEDYEFVKRIHEAKGTVVFSPYVTYRVRH